MRSTSSWTIGSVDVCYWCIYGSEQIRQSVCIDLVIALLLEKLLKFINTFYEALTFTLCRQE